MTDKEFRRLKRADLIEIIYELQNNEKLLLDEISDLKAQLEDKKLKIAKSGSIAEAAMRISGVFEAAQEAADLFLRQMQDPDSVDDLTFPAKQNIDEVFADMPDSVPPESTAPQDETVPLKPEKTVLPEPEPVPDEPSETPVTEVLDMSYIADMRVPDDFFEELPKTPAVNPEKPEPVSPEPVISDPEPVITRPEAVTTKPEPVITERAEPAKVEPVKPTPEIKQNPWITPLTPFDDDETEAKALSDKTPPSGFVFAPDNMSDNIVLHSGKINAVVTEAERPVRQSEPKTDNFDDWQEFLKKTQQTAKRNVLRTRKGK